MGPKELIIQDDEGLNYHVKLIPNPKKSRKSRGIYRIRKEAGALEAITSLYGEKLNDWKKIGNFTEERIYYNSEEDKISLILKSKNMQIEISLYYNDYSCEKTGSIKTRNHWYEKWNEKTLSDVSIQVI